MPRKFVIKKLLTQSDTRLFQDINKIVVSSCWTEALHEIAHWLACDPSLRQERNLGLFDPDDTTPPEVSKRIFSEECIALSLTRLLYVKLYDINNEDESWHREYIEYLGNSAPRLSEIGNVTIDYNQKALELFESLPKDLIG